MRRRKKIGLNQILKVKVKIGESSYPDGRDVVWKAEKECDLILDNFGIVLAGLMRAPTGVATDRIVTVKDITNTDRSMKLYNVNYFFGQDGKGGTQVAVGSSNQAAARNNYHVISILGALTNTGDGTWTSASGQITVAGSVYLSVGGTVREAGLYFVWNDNGNVQRTFIIFRDVISDVVIAAGKYAHVAYTIQC